MSYEVGRGARHIVMTYDVSRVVRIENDDSKNTRNGCEEKLKYFNLVSSKFFYPFIAPQEIVGIGDGKFAIATRNVRKNPGRICVELKPKWSEFESVEKLRKYLNFFLPYLIFQPKSIDDVLRGLSSALECDKPFLKFHDVPETGWSEEEMFKVLFRVAEKILDPSVRSLLDRIDSLACLTSHPRVRALAIEILESHGKDNDDFKDWDFEHWEQPKKVEEFIKSGERILTSKIGHDIWLMNFLTSRMVRDVSLMFSVPYSDTRGEGVELWVIDTEMKPVWKIKSKYSLEI